MDRRTALDQLELIRMDANEFQHSDFAEAWAIVEADDEAREIFARRQRQDRDIAQALQAVPVPEGLKGRLLKALESETAHRADVAAVSPTKARRRWILSASVVLASGLLAAVGVWFWGERPQALLSLAELASLAPFEAAEVSALPAFEGSFDPAKPNGLWMSEGTFAFSSPARGLAPNAAGADRVAVYEFFFRDPKHRHPGTLRGVMLVVPKPELAEAPQSQSFLDGNYTTHPTKPGLAIRSWSEGELVYICLVPIEHYETLTQVFDVISA